MLQRQRVLSARPRLMPEIQDEARQLARLRAMKRLPLGLLALMLVLFVLTRGNVGGWQAWVHAFAEAGMVGALADWFAVVALFRHPLGIPIPHTAIIPQRKNEIGESMARFVANHFLHPEVVRNKLASVNLASNIARWLQTPDGRDRVVTMATGVVRWAIGALNEGSVRAFIRRVSGRQLDSLQLAPLIGRTLSWLIEGDRHQQVFTQVLRSAILFLHDNREVIRQSVQRESPWWLPGFVDDRIMQQMLERVELLLYEMSLDEAHEIRRDFSAKLDQWARELQSSREYQRWGDKLKQSILDNEDLQEYLYRLWNDLVNGLERDLSDPESGIRRQLRTLLADWAAEMEADEGMQAWLNEWLTESIVTVVDQNRVAISSLISDTVRSWDGRDTSYRVELAIGRDLQFIRINGTLVGGLVGLAIHASTML